jgi:hypothetical protein
MGSSGAESKRIDIRPVFEDGVIFGLTIVTRDIGSSVEIENSGARNHTYNSIVWFETLELDNPLSKAEQMGIADQLECIAKQIRAGLETGD